MIKIVTIIGTRPEIIKLSRVIAELDRYTEHILVHTGQNFDYELNEIFFNDLEVRKPDYFLNAAGKTAAETIGNVITKADEVLAKEMPDAALILGDTNSCLAVISAKRRKIPVFHMEAGNRCFDQRVPEEINRKIIDHTSDINLVFSEHARRYLLREGIRPDSVIKVGSPMKEVLSYYHDKIITSTVLKKLEVHPGNFFLVSVHREENVDCENKLLELLESLSTIVETYSLPVIVSTHPRTSKRLEGQDMSKLPLLIHFIKPLGFFDYVKLQQKALCVISDSGTITEESSILSFPAIMIRETHERPEGMDEGTLIMSNLHPKNVLEAIQVTVAHYNENPIPFRLLPDYDIDNVSRKVLRIILSYTEYINRTVWHKK